MATVYRKPGNSARFRWPRPFSAGPSGGKLCAIPAIQTNPFFCHNEQNRTDHCPCRPNRPNQGRSHRNARRASGNHRCHPRHRPPPRPASQSPRQPRRSRQKRNRPLSVPTPDTLPHSELIARSMPSMPTHLVEDAVKALLESMAESLATGRRIEKWPRYVNSIPARRRFVFVLRPHGRMDCT